MDAPLSMCTKEEQRGVIRFLWSEGVTGAEIHQRLSAQYGDRALPWRSVYEWIHGMETSGITSEEKIQESTLCEKSDAHNFLGPTRGNTGTLSGKGHNSKQCRV